MPFPSETNKQSVVREIGFDRLIEEGNSQNAYFPNRPYYSLGSNEEQIFNTEGTLGNYYPLLRRSQMLDNGDYSNIPSNYRAFNIVSGQYKEVGELLYEVKSYSSNSIVFEAQQAHRRITKTFTLTQDSKTPYMVDLEIKIEGSARDLWLTSGVPEIEWMSGSPAPNLKYKIIKSGKPLVEQMGLPSGKDTVNSVFPNWICNSNGFLGIIMDPLSEINSGYRSEYIEGTKFPSRLIEIGREYDRFKSESLPGYQLSLPLNQKGGIMKFRLFAGPFAESVLNKVDNYYKLASGENTDYLSCQSFHGWFSFISQPFAKLLFIVMNFFHSVTQSWAISIILLTVVLRLMLYPLNAWSMKSMRRMQLVAPDVAKIQERHKKNPQLAQMEVMKLYKEKKVNPFLGCFPILIQMPFLIGMFDLLKSTFELRGASFIPGWIDNLTAPDVLFQWEAPIFFIGTEFHLLPILLGGITYLQQKMNNTAPENPGALTEQEKQKKMMGNMMTVFFAIMFYNFPSGLNIYWLSSMGLGILQQWVTNRMIDKDSTISKNVVVT